MVKLDIIRRYYLINGSYDDNKNNLIELMTDSWFAGPADEVARRLKQRDALQCFYSCKLCPQHSHGQVHCACMHVKPERHGPKEDA